ncbi:PRD domain-containing protein [Sharpea azabuensis]|uniref:PRD domain-containing protein n=1 Tax=Sharpea azabuensis TaxID=322505 RepID=UPI00240956A8|nr:PRD domain-containing protein [Sharpea azabuensis]MDD6512302.1 PRD domain-containing protein [Sharpea azabuensis]
MKTTKEHVFEYVQKQLMTNQDYKNGMSTKVIAEYFHLQRSNVSSLLNELVKEQRLEKTTTRPVLFYLPEKDNSQLNPTGKIMIGEEGSLANACQVAKAAILYPNKSLNVLVTARPGNGTTHFVYTMYLFGKKAGVFDNNAPFYKVNCRHYKNNIEDLYDLLFAPKNLEESLFAKSRGGMLFIDNADLLNSKEKSALAEFLELGMIFGEDRKDMLDVNATFLVLSCGPNGYLEFSQRMSMVARLPDLVERPLKEKLELIHYFFSVEAKNAKKNIEVQRDVISALLLTDFSLNVKGLEMEIKRACATSCVRVIDDPNSNIEVTVADFSNEVQKSLIRARAQSVEIHKLVGTQNLFIYDAHENYQAIDIGDSHDLYEEIRSQYLELSKRGINTDVIHNIINNHVSTLFKQYNFYRRNDDTYDIEQLSKIIEPKIIEIVTMSMDTCRNILQRDMKPQVFYGLCLHMNSLLTLKLDHKRVDNDQIVHIVQDYPKEYGISIQLAKMFKDAFNIELPIEEIVVITMFFIEEDEDTQGHPVLLYIFHGQGVASSLKDVTNNLTHLNNAYSYDLLLEKDSDTAISEIKSLIQKIDDGQGVLVIYDMGSIKTMLETIAQEIDIKIRYIYFPITLLGLYVARKCASEPDLEYAYHTTLREMKTMLDISESHKEIIITLCHTGEGGAYQLKQYIDQYSSLGYKTVALSISKRDELIGQVMALKKVYRIHCFVGTYDPKLMGIPFISVSKVFKYKPEDIDKILMFEPVVSERLDYSAVYSFLEEQFKYISIAQLKSSLPSIIDELEIIYSLNTDQKVGLFVHIACLLENLKQGNIKQAGMDAEKIIKNYPDDFKTVSKILKPLEKTFKVIITDDQIADIIKIVNKL